MAIFTTIRTCEEKSSPLCQSSADMATRAMGMVRPLTSVNTYLQAE